MQGGWRPHRGTPDGSSEAVNKLFRIQDAVVRQLLGPQFDNITKEQENLTDAINEPAQRMLALPAHTISGLALKAVFAAYENTQLWQQPLNELDFPDQLSDTVSLSSKGQTGS
jgi:hypothetical protein